MSSPSKPPPVEAPRDGDAAGPAPDPHGHVEHRRKVVGTAVNVGGQVFVQLLRLGSNLILTHLLFPEAFGVMALVNTIIVGLELISDLGIVPSLIQNEREDDDFLDTAWTLAIGRGVLLFLGGCAIAYPMGRFYHEAQLYALVPVASLTPLIYGAIPTKFHMCLRRQDLLTWTMVMVLAKTIAVILMVTLAYIYQSVWALVFGALTERACQLVLAGLLVKGRMNGMRWEPTAAKDIFSFGKWIFLSTLITFLGSKFDIFSLPKMSDLKTTGVYQIAIMLAMFPMTIGSQVINAALLPALSQSHRKGNEALQESFRAARRIMLPIHLFVTLGLVLGGPPFFRLYDVRYADAGWIVQLFMVSVWFQYLIEAWGRALLAKGNAKPLVLVNVARLTFTATGCIFGYKWGGLPGFILGNAIGAFSAYLVVHWALIKNQLPAGDLDLRYGLYAFGLGLFGAFGPHEIAARLGMRDPLIPQLIFAVVILGPMSLWAGRLLLKVVRREKLA